MQPRPYQSECIDAVFAGWQTRPDDYSIAVLPTAAGKTVICSLIIQRLMSMAPTVEILFLAHRKELIEQTELKLKSVWPAAPVGVYSAAMNRRELSPITIASRDTLAPALELIRGYKPALVIIDECHNVSDKDESRYRTMIREFERRNKKLMLFGVTATPFRPGHGPIYGDDEVFQYAAYALKMRVLLDAGYLAPLSAPKISDEGKIDTSNVRISKGEFNQKDLEKVAYDVELIRISVDEWIEKAVNTGRRFTLFYCVSVAHAEAVQDELSLRGYHLPLITGKTPKAQRARDTSAFLNQQLIGLINVGVFIEGTDFPLVDCIVNLKPIQSLGNWMQTAGRGMRISPETGKEDCMLLDFGGCVERFGPIDIAQPPAKRGNPDMRTKVCPECDELVGHLKRRCPCGYEFEPMPFKSCPECDEENSTSADQCCACGFIFIDHDKEASTNDVMSSPDKIKKMPITGHMYHHSMVSKSTGKPYLQIHYPTATGDYVKKLHIENSGYAGKSALHEWRSMTVEGTIEPRNVAEACRMIEQSYLDAGIEMIRRAEDYAPIFKMPVSVSIDTSTKEKRIVAVTYN